MASKSIDWEGVVDTCCKNERESAGLGRDTCYKKTAGFTLIELMIVVFVIGILSAIALPAYLGYASRARLAEALTLVSPVRRGVDEFWMFNATLPASNSDVGADEPENIASASVEKISIATGGVITIHLSDVSFSDGLLVLTPTPNGRSLNWQCSSPNIRSSLLPRSCR